MFNKLFKRPHYIRRHTNAPLLIERIEYIQRYEQRGRKAHTLMDIAQYLLRVIEFLHLETRHIVTMEEIEKAADEWAAYQYNHPQKQKSFSKNARERFTTHAINWLKSLNRLEHLPEEKVPLFNQIFERRKALQRHTSAPLLKERLIYLQYWADNGATDNSLRRIAQYLLVIMAHLNFYQVKVISENEIVKAADCWAKSKEVYRRKCDYSKCARARFIATAIDWFDMLSCLETPAIKPIPFEEYLVLYIAYMREEQGLSENTIKSRIFRLKDFLISIGEKIKDFTELTPLLVDEVLTNKYKIDDYSRRSVQSYASVIRSFLRYAGHRSWCQKDLVDSIKTPRVYRYESLPYSPSWDDVKKVLANSKTEHPTDIRNYAILMLLSVYGMRCSEVIHLRLEDIDWQKERLYLRRGKGSKPQRFPLSKAIGEAILNYLKHIRPNNCGLREVFLCRRAPYRSLKSSAIYQIVSKKLKPISPNIKHYGPHALRHACATHLINEGISLKEISDHLGHQGLDTTRVYAKVDLANLRKVAEFELGDLL